MAMLYRYDQLNRIKQARSLRNYNFPDGFDPRTTDPEPYDTDYNYDANGNLLALNRRNEEGLLNANYGYTYEPGTNKLIALAEDGVDWKDFETRPSDQEAGGVYQHISFGSTTIACFKIVLQQKDILMIYYGYTESLMGMDIYPSNLENFDINNKDFSEVAKPFYMPKERFFEGIDVSVKNLKDSYFKRQ